MTCQQLTRAQSTNSQRKEPQPMTNLGYSGHNLLFTILNVIFNFQHNLRDVFNYFIERDLRRG
jgi:hypothetical protein